MMQSVYGAHPMTKQKHLTLQDRYTIQHSLCNNLSFKEIGKLLDKDCTTISKEIRNHYIVQETGGYGRPYNPCIHARGCTHQGLCAGKVCKVSSCSYCKDCHKHCPDFEEKVCPKLAKPPYICNGCEEKARCTLKKHIYSAPTADREYMEYRSQSRQGIATPPEELDRIDALLSPLIKQGQSIHNICFNNADVIMLDEKTIYHYMDLGLFSVRNIDLVRKVRYRPRKTNKVIQLDKKCRVRRAYQDFQTFMAEHPDLPVVEMDSVEGEKGGKVLLTVFFRESQLIWHF